MQFLRQSRKVGLRIDRPLIVAHRGASGILPEHTLAAYQAAIDDGADFIECDMSLTRDGHIICSHGPELSGSTDAAAMFPHLWTKHTIRGVETEGVFSVDLTLLEVKQLRVKQRLPSRDTNFDGLLRIATFREQIEMVLAADRVVGLYPEPKFTEWHNQQPCVGGATFQELFLNLLTSYCYGGHVSTPQWAAQPVMVQVGEDDSLEEWAAATELPLVYFVVPNRPAGADPTLSFEQRTSAGELDRVARHATAVAFAKQSVVHVDARGYVRGPTSLVRQVHARGMQAHLFTFRNDLMFSWSWRHDAFEELDFYVREVGADVIITDHSHTAARYLRYEFPLRT